MSIDESKTLISDYALNMLKPAPGRAGVLFLSGGSALAEVSEHFSMCRIPSVHLITPFDSGGSSMVLREAFDMPAVGDIRNRILSLSRTDIAGHALAELCSFRMDKNIPDFELKKHLKDMISGRHTTMLRLDEAQREQVMLCLNSFLEHMPDGFSLKGASLGNLLIVGAYLMFGRNLYQAVNSISGLLKVEGRVMPVVEDNLHVAARLSGGGVLVGQHLITGKEAPEPALPIEEVYLTPAWPGTEATPRKVRPQINSEVGGLINSAACICYPMGSFYTSLVANILPKGVGRAISLAPCYKVFIPNSGNDPEIKGLSVSDQVERLLNYLREDAGENVPATKLLTHVFYDKGAEYVGGVDVERIRKLGVEAVDIDLVYPGYSRTHFEPYLFLHALSDLLSLEG